MKRKITAAILALVLLLSFTGISSATTEKDIPIYIDGMKVQTEQQPFIKDGHTFVPMRAIFEAMGATVEYNPDLRAVIATKGLVKMRLELTEAVMLINGEIKNTDAPPVIIDGTTYVPLRTVAEALFATVKWENHTVYIISKQGGYSEYEGVPDFGAFANVNTSETYLTQGAINLGPELKATAAQSVHLYPVEAAKFSSIASYQNLLIDQGYNYVMTDQKNDSYNTIVTYYRNEGTGTVVSIHQVGTKNYVVAICISVPVSLEALGLEATT